MEMRNCINGFIVVFFVGMVLLGVLTLITQVMFALRCKKKIEAVLVDVEMTKTKESTQRVEIPHESRYSKYSYTYRPKREFVYKKRYSYTYNPVYQYEYNDQIITRTPMNMMDFFDDQTFEKKNYKIGQKSYIYVDPKCPAVYLTKRISLMNILVSIDAIAVGCYLLFKLFC